MGCRCVCGPYIWGCGWRVVPLYGAVGGLSLGTKGYSGQGRDLVFSRGFKFTSRPTPNAPKSTFGRQVLLMDIPSDFSHSQTIYLHNDLKCSKMIYLMYLDALECTLYGKIPNMYS